MEGKGDIRKLRTGLTQLTIIPLNVIRYMDGSIDDGQTVSTVFESRRYRSQSLPDLLD